MKTLVLLLLLIGLFVFLYYPRERFKFHKVISQPSLKKFDRDFSQQIRSAKRFSERIINSYRAELKSNVHQTFKDSFYLWKAQHFSARVLLSTFHETLVYIYPDTQSELIVDCTSLPVQMTLFYDLINLNNPKYDIHDHLIKVKVPHEQALKTYLETPASIISTGPGSNYVTLQGGIKFINPVKAIHFQKDAFTTFYKTNIKVERDTRDPLHVEVYRTQKPHPFSIQINGALLITGETNLSHLLGVAKEIGTTLASIEIKGLISSSTFFRQALAHDELSGKIKEIQERKARSEAERNPSIYPLWEYFKDIEDLKQKAQKLGIDFSYVDNLLKDEALRPHSGHLLWYYSSLKQFTMQWAIINLSVLICLILLKYYVPNLIKIAPVESPKILLLMIIISINGFIIYERPKALDIIYWIIPGLLFIFCALLILFSYWAQAE